jgi:deoxyribonuclease IV
VTLKKPAVLLGAHMSIAGGVGNAPLRGETAGCNTIQIFTKNNNRWQSPPIKQEDQQAFLENLNHTGIGPVFSHNAYLINLASPKPDLHKKSVDAMRDEIERAEYLKLSFVVIHPGSHSGDGEDNGLRRIAASIKKLMKETSGYSVGIALETTAGQGTNLGYTFEQLGRLIEEIADDRIGVCFDTCHSFTAGYELRTKAGYKETTDQFQQHIGFDKLLAVHLNDSKKEFQSKKDRHEHIGKGFIGLEGFKNVLNDPGFQAVPMVLETPKGPELKEDIENLKILRGLIKGKR